MSELRGGLVCSVCVVVAAVHKTSKWTIVGCESCPAVVGMLWSFVCAFEVAYFRFPSRQEGRDLDMDRFLYVVWAFNSAGYSAI